ncbi:MAG: serine acetyltransferase [Firmicutes bacterium]|uniref:Serine acetyltransferase n=1 Tax=Candidatus Scatoplasma merdavium TaxID=2840932 RepID=A0A9D9D9I4_9BACL|nr:serine acetyltransferase [Candidatus Scatoplasma merdavium]
MNKIIEELHQINPSYMDENIKKISREGATEFYKELRELMFYTAYHETFDEKDCEALLSSARKRFANFYKTCDDPSKGSFDDFVSSLSSIKKSLLTDIEAIYEGDPSCNCPLEVILTYPGFTAISIYRITHKLLELGYKFVARVLSEYAHSRTGIDIHPGASIDDYFFIDHGTGIVIGETTHIGKHVKLYQGVTLGALSLKEGRKLHGQKRHPTIEDNVVIYSGASIFGGDTVIGENSVIGSNAFITKSIPANSIVRVKAYDLQIVDKSEN